MSFRNTFSMRLASLITILILVAGAPAPAMVAFAEGEGTQTETQTPAPPDACPNVPGDQADGPCADAQCAGQSGTWNGTSCDLPSSTETQTADNSATNPDDVVTQATTIETNGSGDVGENGAPGENGENGTGENGENVAPPSDGEGSVIETGNASAGTTAVLEGNNTEIDTNVPPSGGSGDAASTTLESTGEVAGEATSTEALADDHAPDGGGSVSGDINVNLDNALIATSTGTADAGSGGNAINDPDGAIIDTGRSDAFAYLISLFNVAVTNSTGAILFLRNPLGDALDFTKRIMDIFSDLGAASAACSFLGCTISDAAFRIFANNEVEITNVAIARSQSGDNHATSTDGFAGIRTGNTTAFAGIVNFGNLLIADSRYLIILMSNVGDLSGDIILPEADFFKKLSAGAKIGAGSSLDINNGAIIGNQGSAGAETGSNIASGPTGSVDSGDARASASALNFVNQIGAPLCFIVNVGGKWHGEVRRLPEGFTREETDFGEIICGAGGAEGQAGAQNFHASTTNYAKILNTAIAEAVTGDNTAAGLASRIETGDADAFVQILNLVNQTIIGQDWIFALFTITGDWNGNLAFGPEPGEPDILEEIAERMAAASIQTGGVQGTYQPDITFTKTASVQTASVPATVDYEIVIDNAGGKAHQVVVHDTLSGPDGRPIGTQQWNLGPLAQNEKVTITYTIEFTGDLEPGYYTNVATLSGQRNLAIGLDAMTAKDVVELVLAGEVLAAADISCEPLLTQYIKPGRLNSKDEVQRLQSFLNAFEGEDLQLSGSYDAATQAALKRFQSKYAEDILAPWGISKPTASVYYTTQRKVNSLYCNDETKFELSQVQLEEITTFRSKLPSAPYTIEELLKQQDVGKAKDPGYSAGMHLLPPAPEIPVVHIDGVSGAEKPGEPVSILKRQPLQFLTSWLLSALPIVEALEL